MIANPDYLENFIIQLPGDASTRTNIGDYLQSIGITVDSTDPYTYKLAILLRSYFENHTDKKTAENLFMKLQKSN